MSGSLPQEEGEIKGGVERDGREQRKILPSFCTEGGRKERFKDKNKKKKKI